MKLIILNIFIILFSTCAHSGECQFSTDANKGSIYADGGSVTFKIEHSCGEISNILFDASLKTKNPRLLIDHKEVFPGDKLESEILNKLHAFVIRDFNNQAQAIDFSIYKNTLTKNIDTYRTESILPAAALIQNICGRDFSFEKNIKICKLYLD